MGQGLRENCSDDEAGQTEHHFYHEMGGSRCLSTTILSALAEVRGVDLTALDFTLHDHVDTDALEAIFAPRLDGTPREGCQVTLSIDTHGITIHDDGHIVVRTLEPPTPA